ncbi:MAG: hypothetical protein MUC68_08415 [Burkholderiaceae bacterium]|jgi:hypothetical protein|nr:hypothetical protein [Burkholderiaceae bacterium]
MRSPHRILATLLGIGAALVLSGCGTPPAVTTAATAIDSYCGALPSGAPLGPPPPALQAQADQTLAQLVRALQAGDTRERVLGGWLARDPAYALPVQSAADPRAYGLAYRLCGARQRCAPLTAQAWAQREPDDALAWLYVAADAADRDDRSALRQALERAAAAPRMSDWAGSLTALADRPELDAAPPQVKAAVLLTLIGTQAAIPVTGYRALEAACPKQVTTDTDAALCMRVADALITRDPTLMGRGIALGVGQRSGWPDARVAAERERLDAMQWQASQRAAQWAGPGACARLDALRTALAADARDGEAAVLMRAVNASPLPQADQAQRHRAAVEPAARARPAPTAANAPSARPASR